MACGTGYGVHFSRYELQRAFSIVFHKILRRAKILNLEMSKSLKKFKNKKDFERILRHPRSVTYRKP